MLAIYYSTVHFGPYVKSVHRTLCCLLSLFSVHDFGKIYDYMYQFKTVSFYYIGLKYFDDNGLLPGANKY